MKDLKFLQSLYWIFSNKKFPFNSPVDIYKKNGNKKKDWGYVKMLMLYQVIAIFLGIVAIILSILRFRDGKMSLGMLLAWIIIWLVVIVVALDPTLTNYLAIYTGLGRGLDFVLILGLLLSFYMIFKMYNKIETVEEELTDLVRELAIQRKTMGIDEYKDPEEDNAEKDQTWIIYECLIKFILIHNYLKKNISL